MYNNTESRLKTLSSRSPYAANIVQRGGAPAIVACRDIVACRGSCPDTFEGRLTIPKRCRSRSYGTRVENRLVRAKPAVARQSPIANRQSKIVNRRAFTLVEILVVIGILVLLIGIATPSINKAWRLAQTGKSLSHIRLIDTACEMYHEDFEDYPPSDHDGANYIPDWDGKRLIVLFLTGYGPDDDTKGAPLEDSGDTLEDDDGKDGFGFRTVQRGRVYGPYNGTENIPVSDDQVFVDAFGNEILYYRWDDGTLEIPDDDSYVPGHNSGNVPNQAYLDECAAYRKNFLLISPGHDKQWELEGGDDITNIKLDIETK